LRRKQSEYWIMYSPTHPTRAKIIHSAPSTGASQTILFFDNNLFFGRFFNGYIFARAFPSIRNILLLSQLLLCVYAFEHNRLVLQSTVRNPIDMCCPRESHCRAAVVRVCISCWFYSNDNNIYTQ